MYFVETLNSRKEKKNNRTYNIIQFVLRTLFLKTYYKRKAKTVF